MAATPDSPPVSHPVRLSGLSGRRAESFLLEPDAEARQALADRLNILGIRKLRFAGTLRPEGREDWILEAELGATVVQECRVSLAPVTTRLDEEVMRTYLARPPEEPEGGEVEMPEDETVEPLPAVLDLGAVMQEALALALPPFPRAEGAEAGDQVFTEPGKEPLTDADVHPFASLKALKDRMDGSG